MWHHAHGDIVLFRVCVVVTSGFDFDADIGSVVHYCLSKYLL